MVGWGKGIFETLVQAQNMPGTALDLLTCFLTQMPGDFIAKGTSPLLNCCFWAGTSLLSHGNRFPTIGYVRVNYPLLLFFCHQPLEWSTHQGNNQTREKAKGCPSDM